MYFKFNWCGNWKQFRSIQTQNYLALQVLLFAKPYCCSLPAGKKVSRILYQDYKRLWVEHKTSLKDIKKPPNPFVPLQCCYDWMFKSFQLKSFFYTPEAIIYNVPLGLGCFPPFFGISSPEPQHPCPTFYWKRWVFLTLDDLLELRLQYLLKLQLQTHIYPLCCTYNTEVHIVQLITQMKCHCRKQHLWGPLGLHMLLD